MFKTIAYAGLIAATAAGGHFAVKLAQQFEAQQMNLYRTAGTPTALAPAAYDTDTAQVHDGFRSRLCENATSE